MKRFIQRLPPGWEAVVSEDKPTSLPSNYEQESKGFLAFEGLFDGRFVCRWSFQHFHQQKWIADRNRNTEGRTDMF